jgi:acyl-CoA thioester hydrolase
VCHVNYLPTAKIEFSYEIKNEDLLLINEGKTTLVFMDMAKKKVIKSPEWIINALKPYFN